MRYVLHIKYESKISFENFLKNYFNLKKIAVQLIEIPSGQDTLIKLITKFINLLSQLYLKFNKGLIDYYILARNDCRVIIDPKWFSNFDKGKKILFYGDSIVQTLDREWYESRPKFSRTHFKNQDYIGDMVLSNYKYKSFSDIRQFVLNESLELDKFDIAISKRFSKQVNNFNVPILMDQKSDLIVRDKEINHELSVSVLIPTDFRKSKTYGIDKSILSLLKIAPKLEMEIILIHHKSRRAEFNKLISTIEYTASIRSFEYSEDFNFSKVINAGVGASIFEFILIMNDDIILDDKSDLIHFLNHLNNDKKVGSVGIRLFDEMGVILHAGLEYRDGEPQHFLKGSDRKFLKSSHEVCREVSGCTGAFLTFRKTIFSNVGKMNENFPLDYNDVDLMLKIEAYGLRNLICSRVSAKHAESLTRGITHLDVLNNDLKRLLNIHGKLPNRDPFLYTPADRTCCEKN